MLFVVGGIFCEKLKLNYNFQVFFSRQNIFQNYCFNCFLFQFIVSRILNVIIVFFFACKLFILIFVNFKICFVSIWQRVIKSSGLKCLCLLITQCRPHASLFRMIVKVIYFFAKHTCENCTTFNNINLNMQKRSKKCYLSGEDVAVVPPHWFVSPLDGRVVLYEEGGSNHQQLQTLTATKNSCNIFQSVLNKCFSWHT